jgi:hypothetical protein
MTLQELADGLIRMDRERAWAMSIETFSILYDQSGTSRKQSIGFLARALDISCKRIRSEYRRIENEILKGSDE